MTLRAALVVEGLVACTGGPELNPQPLPPAGEGTTAPPRAPDDQKDPAAENGLALFIACDNLRKGAALNGIQIAEFVLAQPPVVAR